MSSVLFPLGVRLSTWLVLAVFLALGVRDRRFWWAAAAWIAGFETLYQATTTAGHLIHGTGRPGAWWAPIVVLAVYAAGIGFVVYACRCGARPSIPWLASALLVWAVWIITGFHVNGHTMAGFQPVPEALNEGAKTLWALAYLWPLWLRDKLDPVLVRVDRRARPVGAGRVLVEKPAIEDVRD